eukprot:TRINITY_DN10586_c0_g3_i1.p1 TRINITY_DN10586_c0_g3~~TRINITY_DN10586_c0_g3_i1.p1  ORF type:complete len:1030 (+),score=266.68 TRINITY_DN10586_c0_g3_i1:185-3274(+)
MLPPRPPAPPAAPGGMKGMPGNGMPAMMTPAMKGMPMGGKGCGMMGGIPAMMPGAPPPPPPAAPGGMMMGGKDGKNSFGKGGDMTKGGDKGGKGNFGSKGGNMGASSLKGSGSKGGKGNEKDESAVAEALVSALNALGPPPGPPGAGGPPRPVGTMPAVMPGMASTGSSKGKMPSMPPGVLPPPPGVMPGFPGMMPPPPGAVPGPGMMVPGFPGPPGMMPPPMLVQMDPSKVPGMLAPPPPAPPKDAPVPTNNTGKQFPWEGTSGMQCKYGRSCKNSQCTDEHPSGRGIDEDPNSTICRFGRKCKRQGCFFVHPQGRDIDDDPTKGQCRQGKACMRADCLYSHPEGRELDTGDKRACHNCGQVGHLLANCPKGRGKGRVPLVEGQYVTMRSFPDDWQNMTTEDLAAQIASELEVFGTLTLPPTLVDGHKKAVAAFEDEDAAKGAVDALQSVFSIELSDPPKQDVDDGRAGSILVTSFPSRWAASDIGALLQGLVKPSSIVSIDMLPEEEHKGPAGRVQFRDFTSAKEAARELTGQKVAGKPLQITLEDEEGKVQDMNDDEGDDRAGFEMCQDYRMGRCTRGDNCRFSHGEEDSDRKKEELDRRRRQRDEEEKGGQWGGRRDRDRDRDRSRSRGRRRSRERSHGRDGRDDYGGGRGGRGKKVLIVHIDELDMPRRPEVPPAPSDREVYVDPLPDEDLLDTCVAAFGTEEEIYQLPGNGTRRGYVKFRDHAAAARAVEAGFGAWSESERTLSSQRSKKNDGTVPTYPDSIIARLVGSRGDSIKRLQEETGATWLHLRGEDLGHADRDNRHPSSQRVHFIAEGDEKALGRMKEVLSNRLAEIHENIREALRGSGGATRGDRQDGDWRSEDPGHYGAPPPWGGPPPGAEGHPPPPPWAMGPPPGMGHPPGWGGPPPPHWGAPPPHGPPDAWGGHPHPGGAPPPGWGGPPGAPPPPWGGPPPPGWGGPPPPHDPAAGPPPAAPPPAPGGEQQEASGQPRKREQSGERGTGERRRRRRGGSGSHSPGRRRRRREE